MPALTVQRTSLQSNFLQLPERFRDGLSTVVIGPDYAVRDQRAIGQYTPAGLGPVSYPDRPGQDAVDLASVSVRIAQALVQLYTENAAPPTIAQGRRAINGPNRIEHDAGATIWTGSSFTPALTAPLVIGDYVRLSDGTTTLESRVVGFDVSNTVLVLADSVPVAMGAFFNVTIAAVQTLPVPAADVTATDTTVEVAAALEVEIDRAPTVNLPVIAGTLDQSPASLADVSYRTLRQTSTAQIISVATPADVVAQFDAGASSPKSELGFALQRALAPTEADAPTVLAVAITSDDLAGYTEALAFLQNRSDFATVAVLTSDAAVIDALNTFTVTRRALGLDSVGVATPSVPTEVQVAGNTGDTVDIDATGLIVTATGGTAAPFTNVLAGDSFRLEVNPGEFETYVVQTKVSNQELELTSSVAGAPLVGQSYQIWHPRTVDEMVVAYGDLALQFGNRDLVLVFPDAPRWQGAVVPGYFLAAVFGGLRGFSAPQQPLRAVALEPGWTAVPQAAFAFASQLSTLSDLGICTLGPIENGVGVRVVFAVTTDTSSTLNSRETDVALVNAIRRQLRSHLSVLEGRYRDTPQFLAYATQVAINSAQDIQSATVVGDLGGWVRSLSIVGVSLTPDGSTLNVTAVAVINGVVESVTLSLIVTLETL